ncbi:MAG: hypothetical protein WD069_22020 [Planctomycetales bacterium]
MSAPHPVLLYYHEIDPDQETTGGVHELRVAPGRSLRPLLERMLPNMGPEWNVTQGVVNWTNADGHAENAIVELWPPRSPEADEMRLRVARMYEVGGWRYDGASCAAARRDGERWFFVLEMAQDDTLTARVLRGAEVAKEPPLAADHLRRLLAEPPQGGPLCAGVDLLRQETAP